MRGESSARATPSSPSPGGEERRSDLFPQLRGPPQPTFPRGRAAPAPSPTPAARLPPGPHKAHGSLAEESHRYVSPGPCAQPRSPSRSRWLPAPQQRWQLQFKRLIKASRGGGGGGRAGPAPRPRPGARGATGDAGRRAGGCARARRRQRRRGPGAPACASSSGQTLFSSSVELRLVKRRRPPPPSPGSPAPPIPVRGGRLKGTPRLFLTPLSPRDSRDSPGPRAPRSQSLRPRDVAPRTSRPSGSPGQDARAAPAASRGDLPPPGGTPRPRPPRKPRLSAPGREGASGNRASPGSCSPPWQLPPPHPSTQVLQERACVSPATRHTFPHLPARRSCKREHTMKSHGAWGLLVYSAVLNTPA